MPDWIDIDLNKCRTERKAVIRGSEVELFVSPYDAPIALRGYLDIKTKRFVVEFKYIGDEPAKDQPFGKYVTFRVGQFSGRLYGFSIELSTVAANKSELRSVLLEEMKQAMSHLLKEPISAQREDNYRLATDLVSAKENELLKVLA
jgi:hypothetical protein